jgi:hypothetical protein
MELSQDEYWHGTVPEAAVCIAFEGLRIHQDFREGPGVFGGGIYLTRSLHVARPFGGCISRCALRSGTRILRLDGRYDTQAIEYLRREFGKDVLSPRFAEVLPRNKHLTKRELISLLNYIERKALKSTGLLRCSNSLSILRDQLRRLGFHAVGQAEPDHEGDPLFGMVVFDPSRVRCLQLYEAVETAGADGRIVGLKPMDAGLLAEDVRRWLRERERSPIDDSRHCDRHSAMARIRANLQRLERHIASGEGPLLGMV